MQRRNLRVRTTGLSAGLLLACALLFSESSALHADPTARAAGVLRRTAALADVVADHGSHIRQPSVDDEDDVTVALTGQLHEVTVAEHGSHRRQPSVNDGDDVTVAKRGRQDMRQPSLDDDDDNADDTITPAGPRYTSKPDDAALAPTTQSAQDALKILDKVRADLEELAKLDSLQDSPDRLRASLEREIDDLEHLLGVDLPENDTQLGLVLEPVLAAARHSLAELGNSTGDSLTPAEATDGANTSQPFSDVGPSEPEAAAPTADARADESWPSAYVPSSSDAAAPSDGWFPAGAGPERSRVVGPGVKDADAAESSAGDVVAERRLRPAGGTAAPSVTVAPAAHATSGTNSTAGAGPVRSRVVGPGVTETDPAEASADNIATDRQFRPAGNAAAPPAHATSSTNSTAGAGPVRSRVVGPGVTEADAAEASADNDATDRQFGTAGDAAVSSVTAVPASQATSSVSSTSGSADAVTTKSTASFDGHGAAISGAAGGIMASRLRPWLEQTGR